MTGQNRFPAGFSQHALDAVHLFWVGELPESVRVSEADFERLWALHPADRPMIQIHGRQVAIPRWQQAYGVDYHFSGKTSVALQLPSVLASLLHWGQAAIEGRLNGALLNWYDAALRHYIGHHRDSRDGLVAGAPIVTISLGASRTFRLRPWRGRGFRDFRAQDGAVFVMPYETNLTWTHEVPHRRTDSGRRISVTLRAFTT